MSETEQRGDFQSREEAERRDRALALERRRELTDAFLRRRIPYKFRSETDRERIEALEKLFQAQNRFIDTYRDQHLALDRLSHVHDEARDRENMRRLDNENRLLELEIRNARLKDQLRQERKETGGTTPREFRDDVEKAADKVRRDAAERVAEAKAKLEARRGILRERDAMKAEVLREAGGVVTEAVARELENIDDVYRTLLDEF